METKNDEKGITLQDIINVIWKNIILVIVTTLLIFILGIVYTFAIAKETYVASTKIIVAVENNGGSQNPTVASTESLRITETIADLAETRSVLEPVAIEILKDKNLELSNENINSYVNYLASITSETFSSTTYIVGISTVTKSDTDCVKYVNLISNELVKFANNNEQMKAFKTSLSVVDSAVKSSYNSPNKTLYLIVSGIAGLVIALVVVFIKEFMSSKFKTKDEIEHISKCNIVGTFNDNKKRIQNPIIEPTIQNFEPFNNLFTNIRYSNVDNPIKVIEFTSTVENELKTTISSNLAYTIKNNNKSVIILDFDLRRPSVHTLFNLPRQNGVVEYATEGLNLDNIIKHTEYGIDVITSGVDVLNPYVIFESQKINELINLLREKYDYIIIDTPPLAICADAEVISKFADGICYNVAMEQVKKKMFAEGLDKLEKANANIIGICVTKIKINHANKYEYSYSSNYYNDSNAKQ